MNIRKATTNDISSLIKLRLDYLSTDLGELTNEEISAISSQLPIYYAKHLGNDFIAMLAEEDSKILSVAFLVITEKPANPSFITGKTAQLVNVFTYPGYRRLGIATKVIALLIDEAKQLGVSSIDLSATADGKPVYKKLGFTEPQTKYTNMKLHLI